jgi:hypothetical protein
MIHFPPPRAGAVEVAAAEIAAEVEVVELEDPALPAALVMPLEAAAVRASKCQWHEQIEFL